MSLKRDFVERAEQGEPIARLCREFGISRQTGHKWVNRFRQQGYDGLEERSRRPATTPLATAEDVVLAVLRERKAHPSWGPRKLVVVLAKKLSESAPSERTIARILKRADLVRVRRKRRPVNVVERAPRVQATAPNEVWTIDFKGWWIAQDGQRCNPLTVRDAFSRFVLAVTLCAATTDAVKAVLLRLFHKHGVPRFMQCDNGTPFVSVRSPGGVSALSAWLMSLGITIVRSRPASPQDNGAHERMHRDLSQDVEALPAENTRTQQRAIDRWRCEFNHVRPHEALGSKTPSEVYKPKGKTKPSPSPYRYPAHFDVCRVYPNGNFRFRNRAYFLSASLARHSVGIERLTPTRVRAWFRDHELCIVDVEPDVDDSTYADALSDINERRQPSVA